MNLRKQIEIMEAYERGEKIQYRIRGKRTWGDINTPDWNWNNREYRVKPEVNSLEMDSSDLKCGEFYVYTNMDSESYYGKVFRLVSILNKNYYTFELVERPNRARIKEGGENSTSYVFFKQDISDFVNVKDDRFLWFWEAFSGSHDRNTILERCSYKEISKLWWGVGFARPIYALGFVLRGEKESLEVREDFFELEEY